MITKRNNKKRPLAVLLPAAMLMMLLSGCGDNVASSNDNMDKESAGQKGMDNVGSSSEGAAMGRYMGENVDLSEKLSYNNSIYQLDNGNLVISEELNDFLVSTDNGLTWEAEQRDWKTQMLEAEMEIRDMSIGSDNTVGIIYDKEPSDILDENYNPFDNYSEVVIIKPDGTQIPVSIAMLEEDEYPHRIWIADSGRIFISTNGEASHIYEVDEDGSCEKFLEVDNGVTLMQFQDQFMIMDGYGYDEVLIYDMDEEKYIEDEVLSDFINDNYKDRSNNGGSYYDLYFFMGEEGVLYLAGEKGLHRHVIGGGAIEQVIDGRLSIFSNPSYNLRGIVMLDNREFVALFRGGSLVRFVYHADIATVPGEKLKVYSLEDNMTLRQAISLYQVKYPNVFVEYEIGMEEGSSMTKDDALKNLNTKIAAGEGPDVFVLDNMPLDSYIEKGILLDLTPILDSLNGEDALFDNIVDAFRVDNSIYMMPCEIQLPVIFGGKTYTSQVEDLKSLADAIEKMREDYPGKNLFGICSVLDTMKLFSMVSAPEWKAEDGSVDQDALAAYLVQIKRIYEAQMSGLPVEEIEEYRELSESYQEMFGNSADGYSAVVRMGVNYMDYLMKSSQLVCGTIMDDYDYAALTSIQQMSEYGETEITLMSPEVFYPQTLAAINAISGHKEHAEDFLRLLLGKENQTSLFMGYTVNKEAFQTIKETTVSTETDEPYGSMAMMDEDGNVFSLIVYWPKEEIIQTLQDWLENVNVPYIADDLLEEAVYQEGVSFLEGTQSLEETLDQIEKKVLLYMAE